MLNLPPADQIVRQYSLDQWQDDLTQICGQFMTTPNETPLWGHVGHRHKAGYDFALVQHNARQVARNMADISQDGHANYFLIIQLEGQSALHQQNKQAFLQNPGDMALIDGTQPSQFLYHSDGYSSQLSLHLPRHILTDLPDTDLLTCAETIQASSPAGEYMRPFLKSFLTSPTGSPQENHLANALLSLIQAQFSQPAALISDIEPPKDPTHHLTHLIRLIHDHAGEADFHMDKLVILSGTSRRSIYRLFKKYEISFSALVQKIRLYRISQALQIAANRHQKPHIAQLSYQFGFGDVSHFNRLFRAEFGCSPRQFYQKMVSALTQDQDA